MNAPASAMIRSENPGRPSPGPPRVPFVLSLGVTGHRTEALAGGGLDVLRQRIADGLKLIAEAAAAVHQREPDIFAAAAPRLQMVSPLAGGADQIAAAAALDQGYALHTVLPFDAAHYRSTLVAYGELEQFDELLERSECVLELPGDPTHDFEAYVMTGRATIAHCDILLAVWDGLSPRGRGGTAEVVEQAIARGTPVLHVPVTGEQAPRLLWAAFDPMVVTQRDDPMAERPFDREHVEQMLGALLLPPGDPHEHEFLRTFLKERIEGRRGRIEYQLLLAAAGAARGKLRRPRRRKKGEWAKGVEDEWRSYRDGCATPHRISAPLDLLEKAYAWSDSLANHFSQTYRSGHIFNFTLGGFAVCLGLSGFMVPHAKFEFAIFEFMITLAIIFNTIVGHRNEWHRRWLDYRQLAERLRPMRSLKLLGLAAPDPPGTATNPIARRWIDWYGTAIWRAIGSPSGNLDRERATGLGQAIAEYEVTPQVRYHEKHSHEIKELDERLEKFGTLLFMATLVVSIVTIVGLAIRPAWLNPFGNWFTLVSAGFPALGTTIFGIRFQGDFGGSAMRSQATADSLRQIRDELERGVNLSRASDLTEQAARCMLADLDEWRLANQLQDLSVG